MAPVELAELRKQLDGLLEVGLVQPSKAPYGSPVLFQRKQDGSMRMCVDYRALNKVDASDRALGGVLVQDKHTVAFESRKLKDAELRYNTHEKEMTAVIHCLEEWSGSCPQSRLVGKSFWENLTLSGAPAEQAQ
ncbi:UNVERIFIED_CONTAM: Transposon Ty3-G Gag-Pol polyprotein [Sesamum calycinum]|uniref:Transposon Ty3-G Gag-Pol polyprotein n=1 Tax=Sesamum calycinum TaxID=2727403 RepID=A0AAW2KX70_9LAMI